MPEEVPVELLPLVERLVACLVELCGDLPQEDAGFQGLCRFGRFEGGLLDEVIDVCLDCMDPSVRRLRVSNKTLPNLKPPTHDEALKQEQSVYSSMIRDAMASLNYARAVGVPVAVSLEPAAVSLDAKYRKAQSLCRVRDYAE